MRKLKIWFISIGTVFLIYLAYNSMSQTPPIEVATHQADPNDSQVAFEEEVGKVGEVGVGTIDMAEFITLNKNKQVERKWGFAKLLHDTGDEWELEKPYMTVFRDNLTCYITSDAGTVQVETGAGLKPNTKDATLSGNVVIKIEPKDKGDTPETNIYLDEVTYISERAMFLSAGPVKLISQDAEMFGKGMEMVYNEQIDRLEFLRIIKLDSLRLKRLEQQSPGEADTDTNTGTGDAASAKDDETVADKKTSRDQQKESYRCLLNGNVVVETPQHLIYADELVINDIVESSQEGKTETEIKTDKVVNGDVAEATPEKKPAASIRQQQGDITVKCTGGIFVTPMDSQKTYGNYVKDTTASDFAGSGDIDILADTSGKSVLAAKRIDYFMGDEKVFLEGNALCSAVSRENGIDQKYFISASKLIAELSDDQSSGESVMPGIDRLTASGPVAQLATAKTAGKEVLGFTKLKCLGFEYDNETEVFTAQGPGLVAIDNSKIAEPGESRGSFDLSRPCYAFMRDFETLQYSIGENKIVARAPNGTVMLDYIPIVDGQYGNQVKATANYIQADLVETQQGKSEVSELTATGAITYEEQDIQFIGSRLFYDSKTGKVNVCGNDVQPCYFNGAIVDSIDYDLETGVVNTEMVGPGSLQLK